MKKLAGVLAAFFSLSAGVMAQRPVPQTSAPLYTRPEVPSRETLDRLNLKLAWRVYVPTDGRRDGFFSVELVDDQIFVQTRSGTVVALDARDGSTLWRSQVDVPYRVTQELGFNSHSVFVVRGPRLYVLDRRSGQLQWEFILPNGPSAAPAADDERVYICLGTDRLTVYDLPKPGQTEQIPPRNGNGNKTEPAPDQPAPPYGSSGKPLASVGPLTSTKESRQGAAVGGLQPLFLYEYRAETRLEHPPLMAENLLVLSGTDGTFFAISQFEPRVQYRFRARSPMTARIGQYETFAYVAAQDYNVYAMDMVAGRILWRVTGNSPILRKPQITDEDIYIVSFVDGLQRINRLTGEVLWQKPNAARYLAANRKYVYASDRANRLLVLDRLRGTQLATADTRDYVFPISNEETDRIYLAAHDGSLVCLHDREYTTSFRSKRLPPKKEPVKSKVEGKPPADKPPEDKPPADKPPADKPPADKPPADKAPPDKPPANPPEKEKEKEKGEGAEK